MNDMNELMLHFLQDIYYAEKVGLRSAAKLMKAVENEDLKQALSEHRQQSQHQVERLADVFAALGKKPKTKPCAAMEGLIEECNEAISEGEKGPVLDAALIACQQAIEHYEIARYGAMEAWARQLGLDDAASILSEILDEEKHADERLNEIAENAVNLAAGEEEEDDEEEEEGDEDEHEEEEPEEEVVEEAPAPPKRRGSRAK